MARFKRRLRLEEKRNKLACLLTLLKQREEKALVECYQLERTYSDSRKERRSLGKLGSKADRLESKIASLDKKIDSMHWYAPQPRIEKRHVGVALLAVLLVLGGMVMFTDLGDDMIESITGLAVGKADIVRAAAGEASGFKVYYGDFEYGTGTSKDVSIGATVNTSHAFLVMYIAGTSTVNEPEEGSVTGYIYNETHIRFEKVDSIAGTWVSWFVIEAVDEEFIVRARDQITMSSSQTSNTGSISDVQDEGQCTVHSNFRSEGDAAAEWDAATSRTEITASNEVTTNRYTHDSQPAYVRYEVVEWASDYNVYNGTLTMSGASDTDLISGSGNPGDATINMSRSILFATWDQPHQGLRCANLNYYISNTNEVTFAHYSTTTYAKDVTWYLVEFPADQTPEIQTWSYFWAPTTSPGNAKNNSMNEVNLSHTFLASWGTTVSGTGTAYMRAFNLPRLVNSTTWSETQYNPASQTYDDHDTTCSVIELPYDTGDTDYPQFGTDQDANESSINVDESFCVNITITDASSSIDKAFAEIHNTVAWVNYTLTNTTSNCGGGDNVWENGTIQVTAAGSWNYSKVWANDSAGNPNSSDFSDINVTVAAAGNNAPGVATLGFPGNDTPTTDLTPEFSWYNATDDDSDTITYQLMVDDDPGFGTPVINVTSITETAVTTNYTPTNDLAVDTTYYWKVRANDSTEYGEWTGVWEVDIQSSTVISLPTSNVSFGTMYPGDSNDTTDAYIHPLTVSNDGNVFLNVSVNASDIWMATVGLIPSDYYQFKVSVNESDAYDGATETWTQMPANAVEMIEKLKFENATITANRANIDINITVPAKEAGVFRASIVVISAELAT